MSSAFHTVTLQLKLKEIAEIRVRRNTWFLNCCFVQAELGEMDNWQEDTNAWEDESDAAWEAEEVLR